MTQDTNTASAAVTQRVIEAARRVADDSTDLGEDFHVPSHAMAPLSLALDEYDAALASDPAQPVAEPVENGTVYAAPLSGDGEHISVPRSLIGAACSAIDSKRVAPKVLAELRRYTTGDLSAAIASHGQAPAGAAPACWIPPEREGEYHSSLTITAYREPMAGWEPLYRAEVANLRAAHPMGKQGGQEP